MKVEGSGYARIFKGKRRSGAIQDIPQISKANWRDRQTAFSGY